VRIVDSGSPQHVTADWSQFTSYRELVRDEMIMGICGEPLIAVEIGVVELKCKTPSGVSTVTLREVRHAPRAQASLFSLTRATDAGARVVLEGSSAQIETDNVVRMEAVKRGGLWEIETVGKQRAFLARGPVKGNRMCTTAKRPVRAESVVKKTVKVVKVDLDESDDKNGNVERERGTFVEVDKGPRMSSKMIKRRAKFEMKRKGDAHAPVTDRGRVARTVSETDQSGPILETMRKVVQVSEKIGKGKESPETAVESKPAGVQQATEKPVVESQKLERYPAEWFWENLGATTEAVATEAPEHGVEKTSSEKSDAVRYHKSKGGNSGGVWMMPKAKKTARKRCMTS
jgi:hypothetical protein